MSRNLLKSVREGTRAQKAAFAYAFIFIVCTLVFLLFLPWWTSVRAALGAVVGVALVDLLSLAFRRRRQAHR